MGEKPQFEFIEHEFKVKEKVYIIDPNEYDLWEGEIRNIEDGKYSVHKPEFPEDDEVLEDSSRILAKTRINTRIFNNQETQRQSTLPPLSSDAEEPFSDESDDGDDGDDYKPVQADEKEKGPKKPKKPKKGKKIKEQPIRPRPEGARSSPRRGAA